MLVFILLSKLFQKSWTLSKTKKPSLFCICSSVFSAWQENKIIMKKTALFLFMLFAFALKAQETILIGEISEKKIKYYIYPKTVKESERPGYITAWFLQEYSAPKKLLNSKYYIKTKTQYLINCKYNKAGLITSTFYSKNDVFVESTEAIEDYLVKMDAAVPGSIGESMIKAACYIYDKIPYENQE